MFRSSASTPHAMDAPGRTPRPNQTLIAGFRAWGSMSGSVHLAAAACCWQLMPWSLVEWLYASAIINGVEIERIVHCGQADVAQLPRIEIADHLPLMFHEVGGPAVQNGPGAHRM